MPEFTGHHDLRTYLRILWRWKLLALVFIVGAPLAAYLLERGNPAVYRSSALVGVNQTTVNTTLLGGGGSFSTTNVTAIAELVKTTPVAEIAAGLLHPPAAPGQILGEVSATGDPTTNFITISAEDHNAARAAQIANAFARAISINRQRVAVAQINSTIAGIVSQLSHLPRTDATQRPALEQQLTQLRAALTTQGNEAAILQAATPSGSPAGPALRRSVELGLVIGLLLAVGAMALAENADRRLRSPSDLEGITDLPLLAAIAPSAFSGQLETTPEDEEAFNTLRTALTYLNVERHLESLLVTSPGEKDGKTTVSTRLAMTMARAGMRVILVDGDLRRAQVSAKLGIQQKAGLATVLSREHSLVETLVEYPVPEPSTGRLKVVPAGPPPPNPSALIGSDEMRRVLRVLEAQSDIVIIDTPAALAVSDPLPLMRNVTGVVLVARMNRSSKETIRRLQRMIVSAHGSLMGVVATGVRSGPGYEHYSYGYQSQNGGRPSGRARRLLRRHASDTKIDSTEDRPSRRRRSKRSPETTVGSASSE
ncbi:MAG TPA: polysaccharide biosynthesis tyrosine autokinase [Solirubrobacteraceae bacterium]|nr:polysaccharide biosynthesis tyrosine autokinase [Solirubrobacteraceae bacterium]